MRLAVIGSRNITDENFVFNQLDAVEFPIECLISGGASGVDTIAEKWAKLNNIPVIVHLPNWSVYGRAAGVKRNKRIVEDCSVCLAFWDGVSKGTLSTIKLCEQLNKPVTVIRTDRI